VRGPKPPLILLTDRQRAVLERLTRRETSPQRLVRRAHIILAAAAGHNNDHVAHQLGLDRGTVRTWRARWLTAAPQLAALEAAADPDQALAAAVAALLADAPRPGAPDTFTAEQIVQIINLACTPPPESDRPVDAWTPRELAEEAVKRQLVPTISARSVGRFLKTGRAQTASQPVLAECQNEGR
jgi:putative transposase